MGRRSSRGSGDGGIRARGAPRLSRWGVSCRRGRLGDCDVRSGSLWSMGGSASGSRSQLGSGVVWLGNVAGGWGALGSGKCGISGTSSVLWGEYRRRKRRFLVVRRPDPSVRMLY